MIHGIDTGFLVAAENAEHAQHEQARGTVTRLLAAGDSFGIAPQVLTEFIHVSTDARRFSNALSIVTARDVAKKWWSAVDVVQVHPDDTAVRQFFDWLAQYSLGRKRLLDTLLAATYLRANIRSILTTNESDFRLFGVFTCITLDA